MESPEQTRHAGEHIAQKSEKHVPVLDGVRGLAIALILVGHSVSYVKPLQTNLAAKLCYSMWVGVDLFFVLSGFLITGILLETTASTRYFRTFYMRRFLRIFPLYYGALFLLIALTQPLRIAWEGRQFVYLAYLQNTGIAHRLSNQPLSPLIDISHFWSLAVEEQFYFVWPAVIYFLKKRRQIVWAAFLITAGSIALRLALVAFHARYEQIYILTPARADSLMIGALLALGLRAGPETWQKLTRAAKFVLPLCLLLLVVIAWPSYLNQYTWQVAVFGYTIIAAASASLILLAMSNSTLSAIFGSSVARFLGKYSYGIYVLHFPLYVLSDRLQIAQRIGGPSPSVPLQLTVSCTVGAVSVLMAFIIFHVYEARFLSLKRYFPYQQATVLKEARSILNKPEATQGRGMRAISDQASVSHAVESGGKE